jgi:nitroreductase
MLISKINNVIGNFLIFASILKRAVCQHMQEIRYFFRAKKHYLGGGYLKNNPSMLLRKKAHHLERYLFAPSLYPSDFAKRVSSDIEKVLSNGKGIIPPTQEKWARKILNEYKAGAKQDSSCFCPMLINKAHRQKSPVATEDLMELMQQRRSRRIFTDTPLTNAEKSAICQAAQTAPSSCNRQTLYLIFVEEPELKGFIASTIPGGHQFFSQAPCILLLISDAGDYRYPEDRMVPFIEGAAAVQNIYLLCETMGLGCCWGSYTSFGSVARENEVRERLRIPDTHVIVASLAIGKSTQFVCEIPRDLPENRFTSNQYENS